MKNLSVLATLVLIGCTTSNLFDPTEFHPVFKGITFTNERGVILQEDLDDWHYSGKGQVNKKSPKHKLDNEDEANSKPAQITSFYPAFPNPNYNAPIRFRFNLIRISTVSLYIVNDEMKIVRQLIFKKSAPGTYEFRWDLKNEVGEKVPAGIYRAILHVASVPYLYYESIEEQYHGDLWLNHM